MKNNPLRILIILSVSLFLGSCSQSPEGYGNKIAAKQSECHQFIVDIEVNFIKQVIANIKAGKYKSREEFMKDFNKLNSNDFPELYSNPERKKICDEFQKMEQDIKLKFSKDEDRKTAYNSASANWDEMRQKMYEEEIKLRRELTNLSQNFYH